ncbi:MAG: tRNA (adenosine(37)-N6)-dimethylallyltransferase MiaA, partial [Candidatus Brocadiia bacterium]
MSTPERSADAPRPCRALVGPTASGKTDVAVELARRGPVEIVSVDSMQVYRGMDIGTAKPSEEQRAAVPHHMIDVLEPEERCNVARFRRMALAAVADIRSRGRRPLLVGGSPMYLKGLIWGLMDAPGRDPELRRRLRKEYQQKGGEQMHRKLARLDPEAAERIHPNDVQRLVRALEVYELTGEPISQGQEQFAGTPELPCRMVGLRRAREELYRRIERRVDAMMERGLLEEVRSLRGRLGPQASQAVGYKELARYLDGQVGLAEAVQQIKRNTRRYAKHQLTWFRHFPHVRWVRVQQ